MKYTYNSYNIGKIKKEVCGSVCLKHGRQGFALVSSAKLASSTSYVAPTGISVC